ncbi:MAG: hypothetical protein IH987_12815, partial [Planctomycetes bacterium]|nr:hypothetical protein [Planctomycetota bacterium]
LTNEGGTDVGTNPTFKPDAGEPGSQGSIHFSIQADLFEPSIVYVGGDRQPSPLPNSIGAENFSGRLFRGDALLSPGSQWVHLTHSDALGAPGGGTASNSAPHADSREIVLDVNGELIEGDDGGIYRRTFPQSNEGDWFSIIGNLRVTEFHDIAYDNNSQIIIGGTQDNGTLLQSTTGGIVWQNIRGGDGGDVVVDDTSLPGFSIRYYSSQFLGGFTRTTYDAANSPVLTEFPTLILVGGGADLSGQFSTPLALSREDQTRLVIGGGESVYESLDQGDTIREIGAGIDVNSTTSGNAMAYGGRLGGVPNPDVLYVADGSEVFRRTSSGSDLQFAGDPASGTVRDIVIDPENWNRVYAITTSVVLVSTDAGTTWFDITGDLTGVQILRSGEFVTSAGEDGLVVGTNIGAFLSLRTALGTWNEIGTNLPNVPVWDLDYDATDDVLVAGTLGRGAWTIPDVSTAILPDCGAIACLGACCLTSSCMDSITEASCATAGGTWFVGDTCDTVCVGTCCDGVTCLDDHTAGTCASLEGAFTAGSICATKSCTGACCESLTCTDSVTESDCPSGTWFESRVCNDVCFGACCTGITCTDGITEPGCAGGLFFLGNDCGSMFCACVGGVGDCVASHAGVGCETEECCNAVCSQDSSCCDTGWSAACADLARDSCAENDNCGDAFAIPEGITPFDNSLSTTDGPADCLSGDSNVGTKDIWYIHDAACSGDMTVSLCVNTNYDNTLQIYETSACDPFGEQLGCGDDSCGQGGGPATLTVPVVQGAQYLIRTGGWGGSSGSGEIDLSITPDDVGDDDGDGVINSCDLCPGFDDNIDCQPNGIPDGCDTDTDGDTVPDECDPCPLDNPDDTDGDGVCDSDDICPVGDDNVDENGNGIPDDCELEPPARAPAPHHILKNRYISIDPRGLSGTNPDSHHIRVEIDSTQVPDLVGSGPWWATDPVNGQGLSPATCISIVTATKPATAPDWTGCPTVHLTGCPIVPTTTYAIAIEVFGFMSDPALLDTQAKPGVKWFGDVVGSFTGPTGSPPNVWTAPNGTVNADDFVAAIKTLINANAFNATHLSLTDVHPVLNGEQMNLLVNINDVLLIIAGFQGKTYGEVADPFPGSFVPDLTQCP